MSYRDKLVRAGLIASAALLGAAALWACGPYFPYWLVTSEARLLEAPTTWFRDALESALVPRPPIRQPVLHAVVDAERGPYRQTADIDLRELETAISDRNLTARYAEVREVLRSHGDAVSSWQRESAWAAQPSPRPELPELEVPPGLPGEFADYLRGAIAYHRGQLARAVLSGRSCSTAPPPSAAAALPGPRSCSARPTSGTIPRRRSAGSSAPASWLRKASLIPWASPPRASAGRPGRS